MDWKAVHIKLIFGDTKVSLSYLIVNKLKRWISDIWELFCPVYNGKQWNNWQPVTPSELCSVIQDDSDENEE